MMGEEGEMSGEGEKVLRVDRTDEGVVRLILSRPAKRNALNARLIEALGAELTKLSEAPSARVVVLQGEGKDFCSGADLDELLARADEGPEASLDDASRLGRLLLQIRRHPLIVIAAVRGRALAGGCGLATACDVVLAEETAEFGFPEVRLGFAPAMVTAFLRRKVGEARAFELVALGERISAAEAAEIGLATRVLPTEDFDREVKRYAGKLAALPSSGLRFTKRVFHGVDGLSVEEAVGRGAEVNVLARLTETAREGVRRFLGG